MAPELAPYQMPLGGHEIVVFQNLAGVLGENVLLQNTSSFLQENLSLPSTEPDTWVYER